MPRKYSTTWAVADPLTATRMNKINQDLDDIYANGNDRLKVVPAASLTALMIDIGAGNYLVGASNGSYAGGTDIAVTDEATNYVMIDNTGTIQISTTGRDSLNTKLGQVICTGGAISAIIDNRFDVFGGPLGNLDINGLTQKVDVAMLDPLVVSDSEDSFTNKKVYTEDFSNTIRMIAFSSSYKPFYSDDPVYMVANYTNSPYSVTLMNKSGKIQYRNNTYQSIGITTIHAGATASSGRSIIMNGRIYCSVFSGGNTYLYSCSVYDDITIVGNRSAEFTITGSSLYMIGWDGIYFCFCFASTDKSIYRYDATGTAGSTLTFSITNNIYNFSMVGIGIYCIIEATTYNFWVFDSAYNNLNPYGGYVDTTSTTINSYVVQKEQIFQSPGNLAQTHRLATL